jgi:hypothetical protein
VFGLLLAGALAVAACGAPASPAPSGTLVVVIRQGPERVPFHPKVARIQRANQQLAGILGHSIQIELDGSLLPQTHEGAEDVIARLVEDVARDLDALAREDKKTLAYAREHFERLSVRYAPTEAAAREDRWRRTGSARLDVATKTVDVARAEARWLALERGEVAGVLYRAFTAGNEARYANVWPDALPAGERRNWFDYHAHGGRSATNAKDDPFAHVGSVDAHRVRGMVMLHGLAASDAELSKDVRAWLVNAVSDFASTYRHQAQIVESAPPSSAYRQAETAFMGWLRAEIPKMTLEERAKVAAQLFVIDFRKENGERDRFATYAFPGIDPMAFSLETVDMWIAAAHQAHPLFEEIVSPTTIEITNGQPRFTHPGRGDGNFYRWALANRDREDALVKATLQRADLPFATTVFYNAHRTLREEADYLRFLRRFERVPALWKVGADVHREVVYRPSAALLEEARRLWREMPAARAHALFWFARHTDGSYHPDSEWPDLVQERPADEVVLGAYLGLGRDAFDQLPAAWPGLARTSGRISLITMHARALLDAKSTLRPGGQSASGTLVALARILCEKRSMGELNELRAFAVSSVGLYPGAGLSDVVEASDPTRCTPKAPAPPKPRTRAQTRAPSATKNTDADKDGRR